MTDDSTGAQRAPLGGALGISLILLSTSKETPQWAIKWKKKVGECSRKKYGVIQFLLLEEL
jgi:hypothetical protein